MTVAKSRFNWLKVRPFVTPLGVLAVSGVLAYSAYNLSGIAEGSSKKIALFAVFSIVAVHATFFACRWATDDVSLKLIDYIYLTMALGSIAAVLDVQGAALRLETYDFMPQHVEKLESAYKGCLANTETEVTPGCEWEAEIMLYVRGGGYVHQVIGTKLESYENNREAYQPLHGPFFRALKGAYDDMDMAYTRWGISTNEFTLLHWKLFFIYLFCIGAVIRLCKVTAELFDWRVPTEKAVVEASHTRQMILSGD